MACCPVHDQPHAQALSYLLVFKRRSAQVLVISRKSVTQMRSVYGSQEYYNQPAIATIVRRNAWALFVIDLRHAHVQTKGITFVSRPTI